MRLSRGSELSARLFLPNGRLIRALQKAGHKHMSAQAAVKSGGRAGISDRARVFCRGRKKENVI